MKGRIRFVRESTQPVHVGEGRQVSHRVEHGGPAEHIGRLPESTGRSTRNSFVHMSTNLTVRADDACAQGKTISEVAREILRSALEQRALEERTSHLRGRLHLPHK